MKTKIGYKLFEENAEGKLFPLFIDKNTEVPMNVWLKAEYHPTNGFAARGGWHIGEMPDAPWLKAYNGTDEGYYKSRWKHGRRVWCEVEYNATVDYNDEVLKTPKKCFTDRVPQNGFYFFKEAGKGVWSITSDIKVTRKLSDYEVEVILNNLGYDKLKAYSKYKLAFEKRLLNSKMKREMAKAV